MKKVLNPSVLGPFLLLVHVSGMIGVMTSYRSYFLSLTAANLIFSFLLLVVFHREKSRGFYTYLGIIVLFGFLIEMLGVNTGFPFGEYFYGFPFGPQILGTPPTIGLNWFVLTYGFAYLLKDLKLGFLPKAFLVGVAVTAFDVIIEPVAIHLEYWTWASNDVPLQNYATWLICITVFSYLIYRVEEKQKLWQNSIVKWLIFSQVIYFIGIFLYTVLSK